MAGSKEHRGESTTPVGSAGPFGGRAAGATPASRTDRDRELLRRRVNAYLDRMDDRVLEQALGDTDSGMVTRVLSAGVQADPGATAIERARARGAEYKRQLIAEAGGLASVAEAAEALGINKDAVQQRIRRARLIAVEDAQGHHVPRFQLDESMPQRSLSKLLGSFSVRSPYMRMQWLLHPHPQLDGLAPIELLRREGKASPWLLDLARAYGEQGGG